MDESARGETSSPDADPMRALVLSMLDRIEHFAASVISDRDGGPAGPDARTGASGGSARNGHQPDLGPTIRLAVDQMITEVGDIVNRLIAAVIAVLEAISAALTEAVGERAQRSTTTRAARTTGFQPIVVEVETGEPRR